MEELGGIKSIRERIGITLRTKLTRVWKNIFLFGKDLIIGTGFILLISGVLILAGDKKGFYSDGLIVLLLAMGIGFIVALIRAVIRLRKA